MRWQMGRRSENIEDRRGMAPSGMGRGVRAGGIGGLGILAMALVAMFLGVDPSIILSGLPGDSGPGARGRAAPAARRRRPERPVRLGGAGADRGRLDRHLPAGGQDATRSRPWCCSTGGSSPPAASPVPPPGRSTARPTARSISTSPSSTSSTRSSAPPATSPRPMWSPTRSAITSRPCSASRAR